MCDCEDEIIKIILRPFFQILFRQLAAVVVAVAVVVVVAAVVVAAVVPQIGEFSVNRRKRKSC